MRELETTKIGQVFLDDRGELFPDYPAATLEMIRDGLNLVLSPPVQYIQYEQNNPKEGVTQFWPYTANEWASMNALPNLHLSVIMGRAISRLEFDKFLIDGVQPIGAVLA